MAVPLKLYRAPERVALFRDEADPADDFETEVPAPPPSVRVALRDLIPLVAMAQRMNYLWLKDFLDDEVSVTPDLYDVLQTFRGVRPTAG